MNVEIARLFKFTRKAIEIYGQTCDTVYKFIYARKDIYIYIAIYIYIYER